MLEQNTPSFQTRADSLGLIFRNKQECFAWLGCECKVFFVVIMFPAVELIGKADFSNFFNNWKP